ncbi:MAG: signal peptidase I [Muribaculaceae bacterium]|nr:signal peptidase I [Muribaculaceae bacterium]
MTELNNKTTANETKKDFVSDLKERISATRLTRWIRFGIVTLLFLAWTIWLGTWWVGLFLILLFDIYITGYIPFSWWKKSKSAALRMVMSWVDAIVYALILVYFIFNFIGQNYQIPSSSLEKTLLTGDFLWVNKLAYGPRVPMTPVHFPLVHNTLPFINTKSYTEWPSVEYKRLKGFRNVELGDIVVFNFPAGDTVALKVQNPDYYSLVKAYGREEVNTNSHMFGDIVYRPVDRRENYVKRAVGLPGDTFKIINDTIFLNNVPQPFPENVQFRYLLQLNTSLTQELCHKLGIALEDVHTENIDEATLDALREQDILPSADMASFYYSLPLSQPIINSIKEMGLLRGAAKINAFNDYFISTGLFPDELSQQWTLSNYGGQDGIVIPKKGMTIELNPETWALYNRAIRNYEGNFSAELRPDGKVYIDGKPADTYTFAMDYYFMMGDNRDNSQDSRFWGFVPEDHIVGTPMFVLISFDKDRSLFDGKIRWNRVLTTANPDK